MNEQRSPAEKATRRTIWCTTIGALFPVVWSFLWAGLANAYGANYLSDPGAKFLDVAFYIHLPAIIFVAPVFAPLSLAAGNETASEFHALTVCTIASFFLYGFVGWFIAPIINFIIARTNKTPDPNSPPHPSPDNPPPAQQPPL